VKCAWSKEEDELCYAAVLAQQELISKNPNLKKRDLLG